MIEGENKQFVINLLEIIERISKIENKLDKLIDYIIPEVEDNSKHLAEAKELANKGKKPRKQPKKKFDLGYEYKGNTS